MTVELEGPEKITHVFIILRLSKPLTIRRASFRPSWGSFFLEK